MDTSCSGDRTSFACTVEPLRDAGRHRRGRRTKAEAAATRRPSPRRAVLRLEFEPAQERDERSRAAESARARHRRNDLRDRDAAPLLARRGALVLLRGQGRSLFTMTSNDWVIGRRGWLHHARLRPPALRGLCRPCATFGSRRRTTISSSPMATISLPRDDDEGSHSSSASVRRRSSPQRQRRRRRQPRAARTAEWLYRARRARRDYRRAVVPDDGSSGASWRRRRRVAGRTRGAALALARSSTATAAIAFASPPARARKAPRRALESVATTPRRGPRRRPRASSKIVAPRTLTRS